MLTGDTLHKALGTLVAGKFLCPCAWLFVSLQFIRTYPCQMLPTTWPETHKHSSSLQASSTVLSRGGGILAYFLLHCGMANGWLVPGSPETLPSPCRDRHTGPTGSSDQFGGRNQGCSPYSLSHYVFYPYQNHNPDQCEFHGHVGTLLIVSGSLGDGSGSLKHPTQH